MERWVVSINDIYVEGHITREKGSWFWFFLEWCADVFCDFLQKLPSIPTKKTDEDGHSYEVYQEWWCMEVHNSIMNWLYRKYDVTNVMVDLDDLPKEWYDPTYFNYFHDYDYDEEDEEEEEDRPEFNEQLALFVEQRKAERECRESRLKAKTNVIKAVRKGWRD